FPQSKDDHAFITESGPTFVIGVTESGKRIRELAFDSRGAVASATPFLEYAGAGHASVAALAAGPDGLYFSDLFPEGENPIAHDANVYRIRFTGRAVIGAEVINTPTKTVHFSS